MTFSTFASPGVSLQGGGGSGGGGGTPGGSNTQIQYNNSGAFAGASGLTTNGTELTIASGTKTADAPVLNMSQTWNNGAVTFTGLKFNATDTASNASSLLMDLQVGGSSKARIDKNGTLSFDPVASGTSPSRPGIGNWFNSLGVFGASGTLALSISSSAVNTGSSYQISWNSDTILTRRGAANLRLGAADTTGTTAPTPQFLSAQSWLSSTTNNQTGANFTIDGSQGTGTGAGGSIIFRVAPAGGTSNGVQNALATALTINSDRSVTFNAANTSFGTGTTVNFLRVTQSLPFMEMTLGEIYLSANTLVGWGSLNNAVNGTADTILRRDAANTLALRNGANAQEFRVYGTTDGTNSEFLAIKSNTGGTFDIGIRRTGTGLSQNGTLNATATSGSSIITCLTWGSFGGGFLQTTVGFSSASAGSYDLGATTGNIGGAFRRLILAQYIETSEMTAPAAPAANGVRIYAVDNGSGKTQLMALFATGAAQQIAIEP